MSGDSASDSDASIETDRLVSATPGPSASDESHATVALQENEIANIDEQTVSSADDPGTSRHNMLLAEVNPTDRGHFLEDVMDDVVRQFIVDYATCQPKGPFPKDPSQGNRSFSESYYTTVTKAGVSVPVTWLGYSPILDAAYCEPCWLFGVRSDPYYQEAWSNGVRRWQQLSKQMKVHSVSRTHLQSCLVYEQWKKRNTVDDLVNKQLKIERNFWREVPKRLVKITMMLAKTHYRFVDIWKISVTHITAISYQP